jgi:hypothetical protein
MLTVGDDQLEVFEQHLFEIMQQRVERAIAEVFPELGNATGTRGPERAAESGPQVKAIVRRGIESAVSFDIGDGPDIAAFIALGLAMRLAPPGASGDWIYAYLNRPDTSGPTKLRMIESQLASAPEENAALSVIARRVEQVRSRAAE